MSRLFVNQLTDRLDINEVYLASEKQLRPNRQGNLYLQVRLSDKTGSVTSMLWNANQGHFDGFENGDYVRVHGAAQLYNGGMQVIAREFKKVADDAIEETDFITISETGVQKLTERLSEILLAMRNVSLRRLAEQFLKDETFIKKFCKAPAGIKNHHAYHGGLITHVVSVMELALLVGNRYERLDTDVLVMGAFLHDTGKIEELSYERDLGYRDTGQLLGHMVMGVELLQQMISNVEAETGEPFPIDLSTHLKHMVLSHHGKLEFGSPVLPMTLEAMVLAQIDNIDARIHNFMQIIDEDANATSPWTTYQPSLGRKIFKGTQAPN